MRPNDDVIAAWRLLLRTYQRLTDELDGELRRRHGLGLAWYDVLYQLHEAGGRLRMHELAAATLFSRTDCTRIVDRMERAGLVTREPAEEDGRGVYAVLTALGRSRFRRAAASHLDGIQRWFGAHLSVDEARSMATVLQRMASPAGE
jgi:DNA-binding MarR family transcriptional regulator